MANLTALPGGKSTPPTKGTCKECGRVVVMKRDGTPRKHNCKTGPKSVMKAAAEGNRRELLVAMQERVARAVQSSRTPARDLAALTRRLLEISREIDAIDEAARQEASEQEAAPDEEWDGSSI